MLPTLHCYQAAATATVAYILIVIVVAVSVAVASATFSELLIVVCAPAIAVAAGVFVATVAACGGSAAPATLLPPAPADATMLPNCCRSHQAGRCWCAATPAAALPPPPSCCHRHCCLHFNCCCCCCFRCCCLRRFQWIVDCCLCPHHHCCRWCLCCHRGCMQRQNGSRRSAAAVDAPMPQNCCRSHHAPHQWGSGVPPLPSRGYWWYGFICHRGHRPCPCHPASGDKDVANNNKCGNNK
jgi:hypothetical protein